MTREDQSEAAWLDWVSGEGAANAGRAGTLQARHVARHLGPARREVNEPGSTLWGAVENGLTDFLIGSTRLKPIDTSTGPMIWLSPHLGFSKLMKRAFAVGLGPFAAEVSSDLPNMEPWFWRHVAAYEVARQLGIARRLVPVEMTYGPRVAALQSLYGAVTIDRATRGGVQRLHEAVQVGPKTAIYSVFPEAGTTGKRSVDPDIHCLGNFRTGWARIAVDQGLPVVGVAHFVSRDGRSHVSALAPARFEANTDPRSCADELRHRIQDEVDRLRRVV